MKELRLENKQLIPSIYVKKEQSLLCYVPIIYSSCLILFTTASIAISILSSSSLISLSELPQIKPSIFQLGIYISSFPGFIVV